MPSKTVSFTSNGFNPHDLDEVLARLGEAEKRQNGKGPYYMAHCPAHDDPNPSLSVREGDTVPVVYRCFAECSYEEIVEALATHKQRPGGVKLRKILQDLDLDNPTATYDYTDAGGTLLFQVCRYEQDRDGKPLKHGKSFRQRRRVKGRHSCVYNLDGVQRVLYRLPELLEAIEAGKTIYVVEGEKDADRLWDEGYPATTNAGGAKAHWLPEYTEVLARAAEVVVVADNDPPGIAHARRIREALLAF
jgi:hypothetical protein